MTDPKLTRRTLLRGAAGGAATVMAHGALPAWARSTRKAHGLRMPDSLPFPHLPAGTHSMPEIKHVVVLIMENHSFDNLLGLVPYQVQGRHKVDGMTRRGGRITNANPGSTGSPVRATHMSSPCQLDGEPSQSWNASHEAWDNGANDGFVRASGTVAMSYWDQGDLPFTYSLVRHFPIGQRYFCSVLAQTYPNRRFFFTGTASGTIATNSATFNIPAANGTLLDRFDAHGITYRDYYQNVPSWLIVPNILHNSSQLAHQFPIAQFFTDAAAGKLADFTFIDPDYNTTSEENPQDIQVGEQFVAQVVHALMKSPNWKHTALFLTYDEHGGYYDHVPPPPAIKPDSIPPMLTSSDTPGAYDRYGFRVPLIVVSPWARPHYVSNVVQDHTSMLAFIERKWNLPAMTYRDANAHPMTDYFNFRHPHFKKPPHLTAAPPLAPGLQECKAAGLTPPLPPGVSEQSDVARYLARAAAR